MPSRRVQWRLSSQLERCVPSDLHSWGSIINGMGGFAELARDTILEYINGALVWIYQKDDNAAMCLYYRYSGGKVRFENWLSNHSSGVSKWLVYMRGDPLC
jgi:hypothetical protein